jgi:hypothetical protein
MRDPMPGADRPAGVAAHPADGAFWAVTTYFNSAGLASRLENYHRFRRGMTLPLLTMELGYGDAPFALGPGDADRLVQLRGGDVMWQKERLLDLAFDRLPASCRHVAWIDCDIVFDRPDWPELALDALARWPLVQLFREAHYLRRDARDGPPGPEDAYTRRTSIAYGVEGGLDPLPLFTDGDVRPYSSHSPGFAWAMARETIDRLRFFDTCIVGGGDRAMIAAAYGCFDHVVVRQRMTPAHAEQYRAWGRAFREAIGGAVGSISGDIFHLWHGSVEKRRMRERYDEIAAFAFDPARDLRLAASGVWQWNSDKPGLHETVSRQFVTRYRDG